MVSDILILLQNITYSVICSAVSFSVGLLGMLTKRE